MIAFVLIGAILASVDAVPMYQHLALEALFNTTAGTKWTNNINWAEGDPCLHLWTGVTCTAGQIT